MRQGLVVSGLYLACRLIGFTTERFSMLWGTIELAEALLVVIAFFLIARRVTRLEVEVRGLKERLKDIAGWMREGLTLTRKAA